MKWIRYAAIATLCSVIMSGCVTVKGVEGTAENVYYELGTLRADVDRGIAEVVKATSQAVDQIGFDDKVVAEDIMNAVITAKTAKGEKVTFRIARATEGSSKLKIRIGKMGDSRRSIMVLEKIQANLK